MCDYIVGPHGRLFNRVWTEDDGTKFWGIDNDDMTTSWYDKNGELDCYGNTPSEWAQDANYWEHG